MKVNYVKLSDTAKEPTRGTVYSAGMDLYVDSATQITIMPHETKMMQTNIAMEIPIGYFGGIYARSGLSTKKGLRPCNCTGVIDSDYRGSIGVPLHNDTDEPQTIEPYERVAQLIIQPYESIILNMVDDLSETERGSGGFGSTGKV